MGIGSSRRCLVAGCVALLGCATGDGGDTHDAGDAAPESASDTVAVFEVEGEDADAGPVADADAAPTADAAPCSGTLCGSTCVDLATDQDNCGKCGKICPSGMSCASGACVCLAPRTSCPSGCVNLTKDPANCGACSFKCVAPKICKFGACA